MCDVQNERSKHAEPATECIRDRKNIVILVGLRDRAHGNAETASSSPSRDEPAEAVTSSS